MATTAEQIANTYPIPTYRYRVTVGNDSMAFSAVSGIELAHETMTYKDGIGGVFHMPGQIVPVNLTLRRGVVKAAGELFDWINSISLNQVDKKDISISLTSESGSELLVTWNVVNAFPTKLSAPGLDAMSNEIAIEEMSLMADRVTVHFH